jgi:hypothetical protein
MKAVAELPFSEFTASRTPKVKGPGDGAFLLYAVHVRQLTGESPVPT